MKDPFEREVAIFGAAQRLHGADRAAYLDEACAGDTALRQRVEELLQSAEEAEGFLQEPAPGAQRLEGGAAASAKGLNTPGEKAGDRIGHYKLLQQIGEGGCGVVYMAEQEEPVRRRVALKVIKLGMDSKSVIARFEAERQALAMMDHPNIAKVLDAGASETGRPYFVMELVRGIKITEYCDKHNLCTKERLELFMQVCHAVQHAHQKGIIHRDLKPSNILVASDDGVPVSKVIDFGIAKATQGRLTDHTLFTAFEQFIGTPAYMSPEQAELTMQDVDTRTDIYTLGVLLYELLTGKTPFDAQKLLMCGLDAMRRTIREQEPERPSTRLRTMLADELTTTAKHRHTEPPKLIHQLRGDLDWIVMKALEKDRARRYQTANGFARDVERFLADEPVVARPPSKLYRFLKLARRNMLAFAATGAVAATLVIGLAATTWEYLKERRARQREEATSDLLQQLLSSADPDGLKGSDYTVRQLLDDFSAGLTNQFARQPEVEATMRLTVGWTYARLSVLSKAEPNLRQAVALRRRALGPQHLDTLEAQHLLAKFLADKRAWEEAEKLGFDTWQARQRLLGPEHRDTLRSQQTYAGALMEGVHAAQAEPIEREVLKIRQRVLPPDDYDTIDSLGTLGQVLMGRGALVEAEQYLREALAGFKRIGYANKLDGITCAKEIALSRLQQGDAAKAVELLEEVRPRAITNLGPDHIMTLLIQRVLARALAEEGQLDKAEALCKETLDPRLHSPASQEHYGTARTQLTLGRVLVEKGKPDEAAPLLEEALMFFREDAVTKLPRPCLAAQAANWLGTIQLGHQAYPQAETLLLTGSDQFFVPTADMSPSERRVAVGHIVQLYQAWPKPEQAAYWQKKLNSLPPLASKPGGAP